MERKVKRLNLQNAIHFLDPVFGREKSQAYYAAEFVVVPSIKDAMTIIAPEAACCSKPVLITRTADFGELAQCGGAIEVEPSIDGLSYGLDVLTSDTSDRTAMGRKGYDYVMKNYQWEHIASRYRTLFRELSTSTQK
jgi:glycosyltransferase involved in cell wall biosynthesis